MQILNCAGMVVDCTHPLVMGIVNITPDSFYDGGQLHALSTILHRVEDMIDHGVDIIDIGGMSSRPGAIEISIEEELGRILPAIQAISTEFPSICISIDTYRPEIALAGLDNGAHIINDITGNGDDTKMAKILAAYNAGYVLMHMQGKPHNMQEKPEYENVTLEILGVLKHKLHSLHSLGVHNIFIDPGFGFGKTTAHNFELLNKLHVFKLLDCPIAVGLSRKSMIHKTLNLKPATALNGTTALHMLALVQGATILRVHDVKEAKEAITLYEHYTAVK